MPQSTSPNHSWWLRVAGGIVVFAVLLGIWQILVSQLEIPRAILPSPAEVLDAANREKKTLAIGFLVTAAVSMVALLSSIAIGIFIAMIFSLSRLLRATFYPYVIFLQTVPIVAIAPIVTFVGGTNEAGFYPRFYGFASLIEVNGVGFGLDVGTALG